jgi:hypothetical protein
MKNKKLRSLEVKETLRGLERRSGRKNPSEGVESMRSQILNLAKPAFNWLKKKNAR